MPPQPFTTYVGTSPSAYAEAALEQLGFAYRDPETTPYGKGDREERAARRLGRTTQRWYNMPSAKYHGLKPREYVVALVACALCGIDDPEGYVARRESDDVERADANDTGIRPERGRWRSVRSRQSRLVAVSAGLAATILALASWMLIGKGSVGTSNTAIPHNPALRAPTGRVIDPRIRVTTPPDFAAGLRASAPSNSQVDLSWHASPDQPGLFVYRIYRNGGRIPLAVVPNSTTRYTDTHVTAGTTYTYRVSAEDPVGNISSNAVVHITTPQISDTTPPQISITAPTNGASVSGKVTLSANTSDKIGLLSVVFLIKGMGAEFELFGTQLASNAASPYIATWSTEGVANGAYTIQANAVNGVQQSRSSNVVTVIVNGSRVSG